MKQTAGRVALVSPEVIDREGKGGKLVKGAQVSIGRYATIDVSGDVTIGNRVMISEGVMIITHDHDRIYWDDRNKITTAPLVIEDDVFIGSRAIILDSCNRIGKGAFIGAGSIVTKDVPPGVTVAGNPARVICNHSE